MRRDLEGCAVVALYDEAVVALVAQEAHEQIGVGRQVASVEDLGGAFTAAGSAHCGVTAQQRAVLRAQDFLLGKHVRVALEVP